MSLAINIAKSETINRWVGGCVGGWKERRMNVVGRRYGKGLSSEERKKISGEEE